MTELNNQFWIVLNCKYKVILLVQFYIVYMLFHNYVLHHANNVSKS